MPIFVTHYNNVGEMYKERKEATSRKIKNPENIGHVRQIMEHTLTTFMRYLAQQMELSYETCRAILRKDLALLSYRGTFGQADFPARVDYF